MTEWSPKLPFTNRGPAQFVQDFVAHRKKTKKYKARARAALYDDLDLVYELYFRSGSNFAEYAKAFAEQGIPIPITKRTPDLLAWTKLLMKVNAKTASLYAKALDRARLNHIEIGGVGAFLRQTGGLRPRPHKTEQGEDEGSQRDDRGKSEQSKDDEKDEDEGTPRDERKKPQSKEGEQDEAEDDQLGERIGRLREEFRRLRMRNKIANALRRSRSLGKFPRPRKEPRRKMVIALANLEDEEYSIRVVLPLYNSLLRRVYKKVIERGTD